MPRRRQIPAFVQVFKLTLKSALTRRVARPHEWYVWLFLVACCEWGNWVGVSQHDICVGLGLHRSTVSRIIKVLVREGLVIGEREQHGGRWRYRLPVALVHHGTLQEVVWRQKRDDEQQQRAMRSGRSSRPVAPSASSPPATNGSLRPQATHG